MKLCIEPVYRRIDMNASRCDSLGFCSNETRYFKSSGSGTQNTKIQWLSSLDTFLCVSYSIRILVHQSTRPDSNPTVYRRGMNMSRGGAGRVGPRVKCLSQN